MQPTEKAVAIFKDNGWTDDHLTGAGYMTDGQPTEAILEGLRAAGWSDEALVEHGVATEPKSQIRPDERVQRYIALREEKERLSKQVKEKEKPLKEEMEQIESQLGDILAQTGTTSMKSEFGTFFYVDKQYVSMAEHEAFLRWFCESIVNAMIDGGIDIGYPEDAVAAALQANAFAFLTKAVAKDTVVQYVKDTGNPPPGVKYDTAQEVQVRRSSGK